MTHRLWLLIFLGLCVLAYRGVDLYNAVLVPRGVSFAAVVLVPTAEGPQITHIQRTDAFGDDLPLWDAGLRRGDVITAVVDRAGRVMPATSLESLSVALRRVEREPPWSVEVVREGQPAPTRLAVASRRMSAVGLAMHVVVAGLLPLLAVGTALLIGILRPDDERSFYGGMLFLGFSAVPSVDFLRFPFPWRLMAQAIHALVTIVGVYAFMRFFLVFPTNAGIDRRLPWLKHAGLALALVTVAVSVTALLVSEFGWIAGIALMRAPAALLDPVLNGGLMAMVLVGLVSLAWHTLAAETRSDRRRMRVLLSGALVGLVPVLLLLFWSAAGSESGPPVWLIATLLVGLPLFPLSFIYAVIRHRVLGVQVIVRRGVRYALVSKGFMLLEIAVSLVVLTFVVGPLVVRLVPPGDTVSLVVLAGVGAALLLYAGRRVNRRLRPWLDRQFFRERYAADALLAELAGLTREHAADPHALVRDATRIVTDALHPIRAAVFLGQSEGAGLEPATVPGATVTCRVHVETDPASGAAREVPCEAAVAAGGALATAIARRVKQGHDVLDVDWSDPRSWLRPIASAVTERDVAEREIFQAFAPALVVPLSTLRGVMGWILVGDKLSEEAFTRDDRRLLGAIGRQMATALDYAHLVASVADQEAIRRELDFARQVQEGLYPQSRPPLQALEYEGACRMARGVGGDYFDFIALGDARVGFALGDICGKGMSAALLMANLQAMLRSRAPLMIDDIAGLASALNDQMVASSAPGKFATLFYGVYDDTTHTLEYVNAGHNPPVLVRAGTDTLEHLQPTGMALGLVPHRPYGNGSLALAPGDLVFAFSDGITEAMNARDEEFGETRLEQFLLESRGAPLPAIVSGIFDRLGHWLGEVPAQDDATVLVLRRRA